MRFIFDTDEAFSFETLRAVSYTPYGGADIGEVITTAQRVTPGDWESLVSGMAGPRRPHRHHRR